MAARLADMHRVARRTGARLAQAVAMAGVCGVVGSDAAMADWNPLTGVKVGSDKAVETARIYTGPQLAVFGGSLGFLGSAVINGPVLLEEQNGWGAPIVNVAESFNMTGPSFRVRNGAWFTVSGAMPGMVDTSELEVTGGSQVSIGSAIVGNGLFISNPGSRLSLLGDFAQTQANLLIEDGGAMDVAGSLNFTGGGAFRVAGSGFSIGDVANSNVEASQVDVIGGNVVELNDLSCGNGLFISNPGSRLSLLGDFTQTQANFLIEDGGAMDVAGSLNFTGGGAFRVGGGGFSVGDVANSNVDASQVDVIGGNVVELNDLSCGNGLFISNPGSRLSLLGDFTQTFANLLIEDGGAMDVAGSLNFTGGGAFRVGGSGFSVGDVANSNVAASQVAVLGGNVVELNDLSCGNGLFISNPGSRLSLLGDFAQTQANFLIEDGGAMDVDGSLNFTGGGAFRVAGSGFSIGDVANSNVAASQVDVIGGNVVELNDLSCGNGLFISNSGSRLSLLGDFTQTQANFLIEDGGAMDVAGSLNFTGGGAFRVGGGGFSIGDVANSNVDASQVDVIGGNVVELNSLSCGNGLFISNSGSRLSLLGDFTQTQANFLIEDGGAMDVAGTLQHSGKSPGTLIVAGGSDLRVGQTLDLSDDQLFVDGAATIGADVTLVENTLGIGAGGALRGTGTIVVDLVVNGGTVQPEANATALVVGGAYAQGGAGTLAIELPAPGSAGGSSGNEFMTVLGAATLDGRLELTFAEGFAAMPGDSWTIMTAGSIEGSFATVAPCGFTVTSRANEVVVTYAFDAAPGDLTCDAIVDAADLAILLGAWGTCGGCPADLDGDGIVGAIDLALLLGSWGG